MSASAAHLDRDLLSAYLDRELAAGDRERVEEHLTHCPGCRAELDGLARAIRALARLERAAPPPSVAQHVERRVALEAGRRSWLEAFELRLSTFAPQSPLFVAFTVTIALAIILYLFSHWAASPPRGDVTLRPAAAEDARPLLERVEARPLAGRRFVRRGDEWREVAVLETLPERVVDAGTEPAAELLAHHPWLAELTAEGRTVVFRDDGGDVVALRPAADERRGGR